MNSKIKLIVAIIFFAVAVVAIAFYFVNSRSTVPNEYEQSLTPQTDEPMPPLEPIE